MLRSDHRELRNRQVEFMWWVGGGWVVGGWWWWWWYKTKHCYKS